MLDRLHGIVTSCGEHTAVREGESHYSYEQLGAAIGQLRQALRAADDAEAAPVGLLLDRSAAAYASMWACISLGRAYVPLNTTYPRSRLASIVRQAGVGTVFCSTETRSLAADLGFGQGRIVDAATMMDGDPVPGEHWWQSRHEGVTAYILFTSGSTGEPKGVPIAYDNLLAFVDNMQAVAGYRPDDVCSQVCELSFDFSVQEVFLALLNGCTLCPARRIDLFNPAHYVARHGITVWVAVPSLARVILNNGIPVGDSLRSIRLSIFNGESLTADLAGAWQEVAPNTKVLNTYGPTECTVAVTAQPWSGEAELVEAGVVAIGKPFPDGRTALLDGDEILPACAANEGCTGELLLATPQRFGGYLDASLPSPFVTGDDGTSYYRTGDRVRWHDGLLYHLGRFDQQVKIGGHRIEILEIEQRLRHCLDCQQLAVVAHPAGQPVELVLFLAGDDDPPRLTAEATGLPAYMLPSRSIVVDSLPTSAHGKLDRSALQLLADERS